MSVDKVRIDVTLHGALAEKFRKIKEELGVEVNRNVIRILVAQR